ncbi:MAG: endo-1,4-beta-xylanase [Ruminococcus sp.]|nr:endo-1,4-beta-xylanase [Ruminococcus sp.]
MKKSIFKRALSTALAGFLAITSSQFVNVGITTNAAMVLQTSPGHTQETGTYNGYHHEIWQADTPNSSTMTLADEGGGFSTKWQCGPNNSRGNFLARRGLFWGRNNPNHWQDYGNFTCDFDCDWSAGSSGNSRICIYGWTENPLVEYYIIEDWKNWVPSSANAKQVTIDGSVYDVFTNAMNSYNITNTNGPFTQYISVRKTPRTSGTISIYKHFEAWESLGMKMGNLYEVAFNVEGWESDGQTNVKKNIIKYDGKPTDDDPVETTEPPKADENGDYLTENFESGKGDFKGRGAASVSVDKNNYYDGSASLKVSDRGDNWHGGSIPLSSSQLVPGQTYSISAAGLQKSGSATDLKLTLEYTSGGTQDWMKIATESAKSGEWTKLENTKFTVPTGASNMSIYIEAPDSLTDIWLDSFSISESGKASSVKTGGGTVSGSAAVTTTSGKDTPATTTTKSTGGSGDSSVIASHQNNDYSYDPDGDGLKDYYGKCFRIGTEVNAMNITNPQVQAFIKKNFNSITCENEMKPDYICDQSHSSGDNIAINLSRADPILKFCEQNGIGLRGHTFVWYSQTPDWIFREGFKKDGAIVSPERMNKRLESMIKNTFDTLNRDYPKLKVYSYDVCNELFKNDGGGFRGDGGEFSKWWDCYHDDSFVINAFKYARKYAPADCKLYMNDYNEYFVAKADDLYNMAKKIQAEGDYIDGIGMQSHMHYCDFGFTGSATESKDPKFGTYADAIDKFNSLGLDVQITELDVTTCSKQEGADLFVDIFKVAAERHQNISCLTLWGHCDSVSWRKSYKEDDGKGTQGGDPLPFDSNCQPKSFYSKIIAIPAAIEKQEAAATTTTTTTTSTTTTSTTAAPETTTTKATGKVDYGDVNLDGKVTVADAVAILQFLGNKDKYALTEQAKLNADVYDPGDGVTANDALTIQKCDAGLVKELPVIVEKTK